MSLRRQLFLSFIFVAVLPLIAVSLYLYETNVMLAFDLYEQNLYNSTEIQTDVVDEHIRQFMVQSQRFASSQPLENYFVSDSGDPKNIDFLEAEGMTEEILKFTDNTLDSVITFSIIDQNGQILYKSGSNSDSKRLENALLNISPADKQKIYEFPWGETEDSMIIVTPIGASSDSANNGMLVVVYSNDYFLKTISSHKQIETSNSFIYCTQHNALVKTKQEISADPKLIAESLQGSDQATLTCNIGEIKNLVSYKRIPKSPWVLVNTIPVSHIYSSVLSYGIVSLLVFMMSLICIILLSRWQSKRILFPLNQLLQNVGDFFLSGIKEIPPLNCGSKTEIGYLGEKFSDMAADISVTQENLNESNYLYSALLHATYELTITMNFEKQLILTNSDELCAWFDQYPELCPSEKLLLLFEQTKKTHRSLTIESIQNILDCELKTPVEIEACFDTDPERPERWYRIIAVPIVNDSGCIIKAVLHFEDITIKKMEELRLIESSQRDPLCNLLNKQALLSLSLKYTNNINVKNTVFFIDLDHFKPVNDTLGHAAGDLILIRIAKILTIQFRATDLIARFGGDEFVIFVPGMTRDIAAQKAETLVQELSLVVEVPYGSPINVTASIGVYVSTVSQSPEILVMLADKAMYCAKQNGKSQYYLLEDEEVLNNEAI